VVRCSAYRNGLEPAGFFTRLWEAWVESHSYHTPRQTNAPIGGVVVAVCGGQMLVGLGGLLCTSALPVVAERSGWSALPGARGVAAGLDPHAELGCPPLDHAVGVSTPIHRVYGQLAGAADGGAEEGRLGVVASSGRLAERCLLTSSAGTTGLGNSEVAC
jgi:hypothetical protein